MQTLSGFEGDDNFEIVVESNGAERYQLDFPNNRTKICRELTNMLDQRVGPGAWTIHPGARNPGVSTVRVLPGLNYGVSLSADGEGARSGASPARLAATS